MESVADVAGDDERWALGQVPGVVHGLTESGLHVAVVSPGATPGSRAWGVGGAALLGLQDEAALTVEVDGASGDRAV